MHTCQEASPIAGPPQELQGCIQPQTPSFPLCLSAWLLLQTPRLLVPQGDPIVLHCHSWKNWRLYKITFFQDGKPKWFSYANASFSIPHANASHSGAYHCSGLLGQMLHSSQPVNITVPGGNPAQVAGGEARDQS